MNEGGWEALGLKSSYETGELVVLKETESLPLSEASRAVLQGPLGESGARAVSLVTRRGPGSVDFFEFYALSPGSYSLSASWGQAQFEVVGRENLNFRTEFGVFAAVVVLVVGFMAWKFLLRSGRAST